MKRKASLSRAVLRYNPYIQSRIGSGSGSGHGDGGGFGVGVGNTAPSRAILWKTGWSAKTVGEGGRERERLREYCASELLSCVAFGGPFQNGVFLRWLPRSNTQHCSLRNNTLASFFFSSSISFRPLNRNPASTFVRPRSFWFPSLQLNDEPIQRVSDLGEFRLVAMLSLSLRKTLQMKQIGKPIKLSSLEYNLCGLRKAVFLKKNAKIFYETRWRIFYV